MFVCLVLCATFAVNLVVAEYEKFNTDVDTIEDPLMYRSLRDYASPNLRSYSMNPFATDATMGTYFGNGFHQQEVMLDDPHSHPLMRTNFVGKKTTSYNLPEKKTPYLVKMSIEKPYPFVIPKPYSLTAAIEKPTNIYPALKMYATSLLSTKFDKPTSLPVMLSKPTYNSMMKDKHVFGQIAAEKPTVKFNTRH